MTAPVRFKQDDLRRAVKGVTSAGSKVTRVEIDPATGKIIVYTDSPAANDDGPGDWD